MTNKDLIQQKIIDSLPKNPHGLLLLSPRLGKTNLGIKLIVRDNPKKVLWVTPNTKLRDEDIPNEFIKWGYQDYLNITDIVCYASLGNQEGEYDLIILDEYQDVSINNTTNLFTGRLKYRNIIGLSGTHPEHPEKNGIYRRLGLRVLYEMTIDKAVDNNLVAPYNITIIGIPLESFHKTIKAGNKANPFMQTELSRYNYLSSLIEDHKNRTGDVPMNLYLNRMRFIHGLQSKNDFAKKFVKSLKGKTLVFSSNIKNAKNICKNTYHSKTDDKDLKKFLNDEINVLSCVNAGGTGYTYQNLDNLVLVQADSNKKGNSIQKLARSLVYREGYTANIYILCTMETVDELWVKQTIKGLDRRKIKFIKSDKLNL